MPACPLTVFGLMDVRACWLLHSAVYVLYPNTQTLDNMQVCNELFSFTEVMISTKAYSSGPFSIWQGTPSGLETKPIQKK